MLNVYRNTESGQFGRFFVPFPYTSLKKSEIRFPNNPISRKKPLCISRAFLRAFSPFFTDEDVYLRMHSSSLLMEKAITMTLLPCKPPAGVAKDSSAKAQTLAPALRSIQKPVNHRN
ncbi:MAG: hypothetical protein ABSA73_08850 [Terracidiphilus sp.]